MSLVSRRRCRRSLLPSSPPITGQTRRPRGGHAAQKVVHLAFRGNAHGVGLHRMADPLLPPLSLLLQAFRCARPASALLLFDVRPSNKSGAPAGTSPFSLAAQLRLFSSSRKDLARRRCPLFACERNHDAFGARPRTTRRPRLRATLGLAVPASDPSQSRLSNSNPASSDTRETRRARSRDRGSHLR